MQSFFGHFPASEFFNSHRRFHSKPPEPGRRVKWGLFANCSLLFLLFSELFLLAVWLHCQSPDLNDKNCQCRAKFQDQTEDLLHVLSWQYLKTGRLKDRKSVV